MAEVSGELSFKSSNFQIKNSTFQRTGSGRTDIYGPDYFMNRDVVLVTFNYRLHAFGFLSLDDPTLAIPGELKHFPFAKINNSTELQQEMLA